MSKDASLSDNQCDVFPVCHVTLAVGTSDGGKQNWFLFFMETGFYSWRIVNAIYVLANRHARTMCSLMGL